MMMEETTGTSNMEVVEQYNQFGQFVSLGYNHTMLIMIAEYFCAIGEANRLMLFCQPFPIQHSLLTQIIVATAFTGLIIAAVVGNLIVMWIIAAHKCMHRNFNYFLFNMAFADFLIALLNAGSSWTYNFYYDWWYGELFCAVNQFFGIVPTCVSVFTMVVVSLDRCHAVVSPLRKRPLSNAKTIAILIGIWTFACLFGLPNIVYSRVREQYFYDSTAVDEGRQLITQRFCVNIFAYTKQYDYIILFVNYVLPLLVLSGTYAKIAHAFGKHDTTHQLLLQDDMRLQQTKAKENCRTKQRVVKMLALIVVIFFLNWGPYQIYHVVLEGYITDFNTVTYMYVIMYWLAMSASVYNPLIYCYINARFRIGFCYVFRWLPFIRCEREDYLISELYPDRLRSFAMMSIRNNTRSGSMRTSPTASAKQQHAHPKLSSRQDTRESNDQQQTPPQPIPLIVDCLLFDRRLNSRKKSLSVPISGNNHHQRSNASNNLLIIPI